MNRLTLAATVAVLMFSIPQAYAVDEHHPDKPGAPAKAAPGKDTKAPAGKEAGMPMAMMQENMKMMQGMKMGGMMGGGAKGGMMGR